MNYEDELEFIEILETIKYKLNSAKYRLILAESLVVLLNGYSTSATEIKNCTNKILISRNIEGISLGFVRGIIQEK